MSLLETMLEGFDDLATIVRKIDISEKQDLELAAGKSKLHSIRKNKSQSISKLKEVLDVRFTPRLLNLRGSLGEVHKLAQQKIDRFIHRGVLEPIQVLSKETASELRELAEAEHEGLFTQSPVIGETVKVVLQRHNLWNLNYSGMFQGYYQPRFKQLCAHPAVIEHLTPLMGDDLMIWRTQFFEKKPGAAGSFWHQAGTFKENSPDPKLRPTQKMDPAMVQLTTWIALTDSTQETACMRFIPGSYQDGRVEGLFEWMMRDPYEFISFFPENREVDLMKAVFFTPGNFVKYQVAVELAFEIWPDLYKGLEAVDMEVKAGEAIVFSSLNMHASRPNTSKNLTRLAYAGRYTSPDIAVYEGKNADVFATPEGNVPFSLDRVKLFMANGQDRYHLNSKFFE